MMIQTNGVTKTYGNKTAVDRVSLHVQKNTVYGLLGPNGAGKSTLLKMIAGIASPTKGEMFFDGHVWSRADLAELGALIENPPLYGNLSAYENLKIRALLLQVPQERIEEVLRCVGLEGTGKKRAGQFSLGMKQRLGIALALLHEPKLLILDEPMNGLDPFGMEELREMIKEFPKRGITVIVSSHILSEVQQVAEYVGIMSEGKLEYEGKIEKGVDLENLFMRVVKKGREVR